MSFLNDKKHSSDETEETKEFFLKWARMIDPPPLTEEFHERLRQNLSRISSNPEERHQFNLSSAGQLDEPLQTAALPQVSEPGATHPLSKTLIERNLDDIELKHSRDDNDDTYVVFSGDGLPGDLSCWFLIRDVVLKHSRDDDDDMYVVFSGDGLPGDLSCWFLIRGEDSDVLRLLITIDPTIPKENWGIALRLCNRHHDISQWGRCYLDIKEGEPEARLFFEEIVDLKDGATDEYLQRFIKCNLFAAYKFFEQFKKLCSL